MIKRILSYMNKEDKEMLSTPSEEVNENDNILELIQDLKETLLSSEGTSGVGLSAVQIGVLKRVCIIFYSGKELVLINPKIVWTRNGPHSEKEFEEGCMSVPGFSAKISRPQKIICEYTDEKGELKQIGDGGWMSAIIQHEIDHMNGISKLYELVKEYAKNENEEKQ